MRTLVRNCEPRSRMQTSFSGRAWAQAIAAKNPGRAAAGDDDAFFGHGLRSTARARTQRYFSLAAATGAAGDFTSGRIVARETRSRPKIFLRQRAEFSGRDRFGIRDRESAPNRASPVFPARARGRY